MVLYRPYSIIAATRLMGELEEKDIRIDWVCYFRDEPLIPCHHMIADYSELVESGEDRGWLQRRANNFLNEEELEELRDFLKRKFALDVEVEKFNTPIHSKALPWFKEKYVNSMIILSESGEPLSASFVGMVSPFKNITSVNTVNELLREMEKHNEK